MLSATIWKERCFIHIFLLLAVSDTALKVRLNPAPLVSPASQADKPLFAHLLLAAKRPVYPRHLRQAIEKRLLSSA